MHTPEGAMEIIPCTAPHTAQPVPVNKACSHRTPPATSLKESFVRACDLIRELLPSKPPACRLSVLRFRIACASAARRCRSNLRVNAFLFPRRAHHILSPAVHSLCASACLCRPAAKLPVRQSQHQTTRRCRLARQAGRPAGHTTHTQSWCATRPSGFAAVSDGWGCLKQGTVQMRFQLGRAGSHVTRTAAA